MQGPGPIRIQAVIAAEGERAVFHEGVRQASLWLQQADFAAPEIALRFGPRLPMPGPERDGGPDREGSPAADVTFVSFLGAARSAEGAFDTLAAGWRRQIEAFCSASDAPLFLCTVFRHVGTSEDAHPGALTAQRERIRRINLFIAEVSQATGALVVDIDSVLAHAGAARLRSDFALKGRWGMAAAGDAIASALLRDGLDGLMPADGLARAVALHGGRRGLYRRLDSAIGAADDAA